MGMFSPVVALGPYIFRNYTVVARGAGGTVDLAGGEEGMGW
jgi:hypothetical protein